MCEVLDLSNTEDSITRENYGGKAANLAKLSRIEGVSVPEGLAISTESHSHYQDQGFLDEGVIDGILAVRERLGDVIAIRSSGNTEDGENASLAGVFTTEVIDLSGGEDEDEVRGLIRSAIKAVYDQASSDTARASLESQGITKNVEMGLVVQRYIEPQISGVVYTGANGDGESYLIQYHNGRGDEIVDGNTNGVRIRFDPSREIITESINYDNLPFPEELLTNLVKNIGSIVDHFGRPQDIEFAIDQDSGEVYIVQARTLTAEIPDRDMELSEIAAIENIRRNFERALGEDAEKYGLQGSIFINSNFAELIPNPSEMDFAIFRYIFTGLFGTEGAIQLGREELGYVEQTRAAGYLEMHGNRPYFSLAGDAATYYVGIPDDFDEYRDEFIQSYINAVKQDPARANYPEMGLYIQNPSREELVEMFGEENAEVYYQRLLEFQEHLRLQAEIQGGIMEGFAIPQIDRHISELEKLDINRFDNNELVSHVHGVLEHMRTVSCVEFVKAARLGFYYSQRFRELMSDLGHSDQNADRYYAALSEDPDGNIITDIDLRIIQAESAEDALGIARETIGFYSAGEDLEIRHPRFSDNERDLRNYVEGLRENGDRYMERLRQSRERNQATRDELLVSIGNDSQREEVENVIRYMQQYMALRQNIKFHFKREYGVIRRALVRLEEALNLEDGDIFYVYPRELGRLIDNPDKLRHLIADRRRHHVISQRIEIPDVVTEENLDDIDIVDDNGMFTEASGEVLSAPERLDVENYVTVVLDENCNMSEETERISSLQEKGLQVVLVARQIGLTLDNLIIQANALIIQHGGVTCHAAQRCRELGTPLIAGVVIRNIQDGQSLVIDYDSGNVRSFTPLNTDDNQDYSNGTYFYRSLV